MVDRERLRQSQRIARQVKRLEREAQAEAAASPSRLSWRQVLLMICAIAIAVASHLWLRPPRFDRGRAIRARQMAAEARAQRPLGVHSP